METLKFVMVSTHFPPTHLGGDAVFAEYLTDELVRLGHEVHIFTSPGAYSLVRGPSRPSSDRAYLGRTVHRLNPSFPRMRVISALVGGTQRTASHSLDELFGTLKPDVVHWHNTKGLIGKPYPFMNAVNVYTAHDYYPICPRSNLLRPDLTICRGPYNCVSCHLKWRKPPPLWRFGRNRVVRFDKQFALISPSEFLRRRFAEDGITIDRVIRNFTPEPSKSPEAPDSNDRTILYVGMLEPHKGLGTMIRGFAASMHAHNFNLKIVGQGSVKDDIAQLISELNIRNRVETVGYISRHNLDELRSQATFQIVPSEWPENAPLTAIEALSFGIPLIVSDQGGLPEIAYPEDGSLMFRGGDADSLSQCLVRAWGSLDDIGRIRIGAVDKYRRLYTANRHVTDYLNLIRDHGPDRALDS